MASLGDMGAGARALVVETIAKIGRAYFVQKKPIKAICREFRLSRTVVRKVIRSSGLRLPGFIASVAGNDCHGLIRGGRSLTGCYSQTRASRRASGLCCPRRTRIPALRADRRTAPVSSDQPGLRANLGHCHHQSRFWRMARRLWRRQDDDGTPRPADPFLRNHRNRQRELALQASTSISAKRHGGWTEIYLARDDRSAGETCQPSKIRQCSPHNRRARRYQSILRQSTVRNVNIFRQIDRNGHLFVI